MAQLRLAKPPVLCSVRYRLINYSSQHRQELCPCVNKRETKASITKSQAHHYCKQAQLWRSCNRLRQWKFNFCLMPRPHSVPAGSRAQGLPWVSALGKARLSNFAMDLANFFRMKESSNGREPASPRGSLCKGKASLWGVKGRWGFREGGCHLQGHCSLLSKTFCLNTTVIWGGDHTEKLPSTSQHWPKLLHKPSKTRWRKEKPPVPQTVLTSGVLLGTNWEIEKKSQSFCWRDLGRKGRLNVGRLISSGKEPGSYAFLQVFWKQWRGKPLKERH